VRLTVANAVGSDTEERVGYVRVISGTYTVFVEAVSDYHYTQPLLGSAVPLAQTFYNNLVGSQSNGVIWNGYGEYYNDNAGSKHWSVSEPSAVKADNADFALFVGHGWNDKIYFGTPNSVLELSRTDMRFGASKAKWVTMSSCFALNHTTETNWHSLFAGLHILNGYDTEGLLTDRQGGIYAARLTGGVFEGQNYQLRNIRDSWRVTLEDTINRADHSGAWMWADPCGDDYFPGYGDFCAAPTITDGVPSIQYDKFDCDPTTSD
jgi:hypothetical protein